MRELCARTKLRPRTLVEIGCGDGALLAALRGLAPVFDGFELSAPAAELARRALPDARRIEAFDGFEVPAEDDSYDLAILSHVLEHVPVPLPLLAEAARVAHEVLVEVPLEDNRSAPPAREARRGRVDRPPALLLARRRSAGWSPRPGWRSRPSSRIRCPTRTTRSSRTASPRAPARPPSGPCGPRRIAWRRGRPRRCSRCTTPCWLGGRRRGARRLAPCAAPRRGALERRALRRRVVCAPRGSSPELFSLRPSNSGLDAAGGSLALTASP